MDRIICAKCGCELETVKATGNYLDFHFPVELLGCPKCGEVLVTEELVRGKIATLESMLEQK